MLHDLALLHDIGKITGTAGDVLVIEVQEKVRVRIPRAYVEAPWNEQDAKPSDLKKSAA